MISPEHKRFLAGDPDHELRAWAKLKPAWPGDAQGPHCGVPPQELSTSQRSAGETGCLVYGGPSRRLEVAPGRWPARRQESSEEAQAWDIQDPLLPGWSH